MNVFKVNLVAENISDRNHRTSPIELLVEPDSNLTWLPADTLENAGIHEIRKRTFQTATKQLIERNVGYAILWVEDFETVAEVVFAEKGDTNLFGVRTLEGFGVVVDNIAHRFLVQATLAV